jgi:hypothetical protein
MTSEWLDEAREHKGGFDGRVLERQGDGWWYVRVERP